MLFVFLQLEEVFVCCFLLLSPNSSSDSSRHPAKSLLSSPSDYDSSPAKYLPSAKDLLSAAIRFCCVKALKIFEMILKHGKFHGLRRLPNGSLMDIVKVYSLDALFYSLEDVPEDEVAETVKNDFVTEPVLETSRKGNCWTTEE